MGWEGWLLFEGCVCVGLSRGRRGAFVVVVVLEWELRRGRWSRWRRARGGAAEKASVSRGLNLVALGLHASMDHKGQAKEGDHTLGVGDTPCVYSTCTLCILHILSVFYMYFLYSTCTNRADIYQTSFSVSCPRCYRAESTDLARV